MTKHATKYLQETGLDTFPSLFISTAHDNIPVSCDVSEVCSTVIVGDIGVNKFKYVH